MLSDIEISQKTKMLDIRKIGEELGIKEDELELYGKYKAKLSDELEKRVSKNKDGKLILVTAINPTPAGEGKTTTTIGLGQAFKKIGKKGLIVLREPSLGPVFGIKGGATGGGYSQVVPMEEINLHFTGDFHAIGAANNLLCAALDNHIMQGNVLNIDKERVLVKRAVDMNDRALREIIIGIGEKNGEERKDSFLITVASEVMAILCLSKDIHELKEKLGNILIAYNLDGKPVFARELKVHGAMAAVLKDALKPNLIQTTENTPCIMHGGPFANIAHGCNSIRATKLGLKLADYCITEAGFGADLGAEKFLDIKCRLGNLKPDAIVIVATIRALKYNGGIPKDNLKEPNVDALKIGLPNLEKHIENMKKYGPNLIVALNKFDTDTDEEIEQVRELCEKSNVEFELSEIFAKGGDGGLKLAEKVANAADANSTFKVLYDEKKPIKEKIETIAKEIYGAKEVEYSEEAEKNINDLTKLGYDKIPVCIAKTQYSLSDDPKALSRPKDFTFHIREVKPSLGAGFLVALAGNIMTMPGLPKVPAYERIDVDDNGKIVGIF